MNALFHKNLTFEQLNTEMSKIVSISEAASIAIHGIVLIAKSPVHLNATRIAELTGTSRHHVAKVMQRLVRSRLVTSLRGPAGGFSLSRSPESLTLLEVYEAIEGKIEIQKCPMGKQICPFDQCIMNNVMTKLSINFRDYLAQQKISDYLK